MDGCARPWSSAPLRMRAPCSLKVSGRWCTMRSRFPSPEPSGWLRVIWWVAGPVADSAENAHVDLDEVEQFFTGLGLWARLA